MMALPQLISKACQGSLNIPNTGRQELADSRAAAKAARIEAWRQVCSDVRAERAAAAEAVAGYEDARVNARSQQQYDRATVAMGAAQSRSQTAECTQVHP